MNDTIVFGIHNLRRYSELVRIIFHKGLLHPRSQMQMNDAYKKNTFFDPKVIEQRGIINLHELQVNGRINYTAHNKVKITSSEYDIQIYISQAKDKIEINLSLPKLMYGSNVVQSIKPYGGKGFTREYYKHPENQINYCFNLIHRTVRYLERIFDQKIYLEDVSIDRIDFCFNIICKTSADKNALLYRLKEIKKPYERDKNSMNRYKTSIYFVTDDYSFKFYDKGNEFLHTKNLNICRRISRKYHNYNFTNKYREYFTDYANRILRFEITFRVKKMSTESLKRFKNNEFFKKCKYDYFHNCKKGYAQYYKLLKDTSFDFRLALDPDEEYEYINLKNFYTTGSNKKKISHLALFDLTMYKILFKKFKDILTFYSSRNLPDIVALDKRIDIINNECRNTVIRGKTKKIFLDNGEIGYKTYPDRIKPEVSKTLVTKYFKLFEKGYSLENLKNEKMISIATYTRLKRLFKKVDITPFDHLYTVPYEFNYDKYYKSEGGMMGSFTMYRLTNI